MDIQDEDFLAAVDNDDAKMLEKLLQANTTGCVKMAVSRAFQMKKGATSLNLFIKYNYLTHNEVYAKAVALRKNSIARYYLKRKGLDIKQALEDTIKHGNIDMARKIIPIAFDKNINLDRYLIDIIKNNDLGLVNIFINQVVQYINKLIILAIRYNNLPLVKYINERKNIDSDDDLFKEYIHEAFKYHRKNFIEWFIDLDHLVYIDFYLEAAHRYGNIDTFGVVIEYMKQNDIMDNLYLNALNCGDPQNEFSNDPLVVREYFRIKGMFDLLASLAN